MEATKPTEANNAAASCCAPAGKAGWLSPRNLLIGALVLGGAGALFFGWNWLVAAGFGSLIVGVLPCLAMCALGICASRMGKKQTPQAATTQELPPSQAGETAVPQEAKRVA